MDPATFMLLIRASEFLEISWMRCFLLHQRLFILCSSDGEAFIIEAPVALESKLIRDMLHESEISTIIRLPCLDFLSIVRGMSMPALQDQQNVKFKRWMRSSLSVIAILCLT